MILKAKRPFQNNSPSLDIKTDNKERNVVVATSGFIVRIKCEKHVYAIGPTAIYMMVTLLPFFAEIMYWKPDIFTDPDCRLTTKSSLGVSLSLTAVNKTIGG
jgi:hypothetical protein